MYVLKFGGTSMNNEQTWRQVLDIISEYTTPVVIVSATARTTRQLVAAAEMAPTEIDEARKIAATIGERHTAIIKNFLAHDGVSHPDEVATACATWISRCMQQLNELLSTIADQKKITPPLTDALASIGEQLSAYLFAQCGRVTGLSTQWVDAKEVIKTDAAFGNAVPNRAAIKNSINLISNHLKKDQIPIMGGFYGSNEQGQITTLGFEGSDYTASLTGAHLQAEAIEIWTDVSGIFTCDPRVVKRARPIPELSFQEATELAYFGAKVLHPSTMKPAAAAQIPVYVKNIFEPNQPGTKIHRGPTLRDEPRAVTYLKEVTILAVTAAPPHPSATFLTDILELLRRENVTVHVIKSTNKNVFMALPPTGRLSSIKNELHPLGSVEIINNQALISIIGCTFDDPDGFKQKFLADFNLNAIWHSKNKQRLSMAVAETALIPTVRRIHQRIFSEK